MIIQKPSSVIVEQGQNVSLQCKATGQPTPKITWRKALSDVPKARAAVIDGKLTLWNVTKADSGAYACSAKNLLGQDSAVAIVMVTDRLEYIITPPLKVVAKKYNNVMLNCTAQGTKEIVWKRAGKILPRNHVLYPNGTLHLKNVSQNDSGSYICVAKNFHRSIEATTVLEVLKKEGNCVIL